MRKSWNRFREISEGDYKKGDEGIEYYEQALIDKEVYVFYTYPPKRKN